MKLEVDRTFKEILDKDGLHRLIDELEPGCFAIMFAVDKDGNTCTSSYGQAGVRDFLGLVEAGKMWMMYRYTRQEETT